MMDERIVELEAEVASLQRQITERDAAQRRAIAGLAATIGHGLRNPLAAVRNAHYYLDRQMRTNGFVDSDPHGDEYLKIIGRQLTHATQVIRDLLEFAHDEDLVRSACPVDKLVAAAVRAATIPERISVEIDVPDELPIPSWDWEASQRAICNILRNSVDAIGGEGSIAIDAVSEGSDIVIRIADTGKGIPAEELEHVFTPLFTTKARGSGLGLAVVEAIAERHGGRVSCTSSPAGGTTITLTMPVSR